MAPQFVGWRWTAALAMIAGATPGGVFAQAWSFTRIADSSTPVPGSSTPFLVFEVPSIRNGTVGFAGFGGTMTGPAGVYTGDGGPLTIVADRATPIPGGLGNFTGFALGEALVPSLNMGVTAFIGDGFGTSFIQRGIYLRDSGGLTRVVDRAIPMPNGSGASFFNIWPPSLENGRVVFAGWALGDGQRGVYSWESGSLSVIADKSTPIPGGSGTFASIREASLDGGRVLFQGSGASGYQGLFLADKLGLTRIYDTTTPIPGGTGTFTGLAQSGLSDGRVVFRGGGVGGQGGIYTDVSGELRLLAGFDTPVPGFPGQTFGGFGFVAINEGVIAFTGLAPGAWLGVFSTHGGALQKVLAHGDLLDGRIVEDAFIGMQALHGDSIAMQVTFTNGTQGIYMATIPAPGAGLMIAGFGLFAARRQRST